MKKLQLDSFQTTWGEKKAVSKGSSKKMNDVEGSEADNKCVAQNWFRYSKERDTSHEDKERSGRLSIVPDEALFKIVEQQPIINILRLSIGFGHLTFS